MKIAVLGGGMIGSVIAEMLIDGQHIVNLVDREVNELNHQLISWDDSSSHTDYKDFLSSTWVSAYDLIVNALPGKIGFDALTMAVKAGKNVIDVSFWDYDQDKVDALDKLAKERGVTVLFDLGWSPGMTNILIGNAMAELGDVESVDYYVGGLPQDPRWPWNYQSPYCIEDSIKFASSWSPAKKTFREDLECCKTPFERRSLPDNCLPHVYRNEGFYDMALGVRMAGCFTKDNINHMVEILRNEWAIDENYRDISYMDIYVRGKDKTIEYHMVDKYCEASKTTSMAKLTATTAVLGVDLMINRAFIDGAGLLTPEYLGSEYYFNHFWVEWQSSGIIIEKKIT